ncbi:MAG: phospholipase D-like domain-containing protein [Arsenophonus sp.]|nr:MAG: phospholipase D-like domain-containing protein [Arsenophonus sp.]
MNLATYTFTNYSIASELIKAKERGVLVNVIVDYKNSKNYSSILKFLKKNGVFVKICKKYSIMHNKFLIVDGKTIVTGSFNYTYNAHLRNAENVIYIRNNFYVSKNYLKEFYRLWNESYLFF